VIRRTAGFFDMDFVGLGIDPYKTGQKAVLPVPSKRKRSDEPQCGETNPNSKRVSLSIQLK